MTPEVARKLHELVAAGATITGPRPVHSPSLAHLADADEEVHALATGSVGRHGWGDAEPALARQGNDLLGLTLDEVLARVARRCRTSHRAARWTIARRGCIGIPRMRRSILWRTRRMRRCIWMRDSVSRAERREVWRPMDGAMTRRRRYRSGARLPMDQRSGKSAAGD